MRRNPNEGDAYRDLVDLAEKRRRWTPVDGPTGRGRRRRVRLRLVLLVLALAGLVAFLAGYFGGH